MSPPSGTSRLFNRQCSSPALLLPSAFLSHWALGRRHLSLPSHYSHCCRHYSKLLRWKREDRPGFPCLAADQASCSRIISSFSALGGLHSTVWGVATSSGSQRQEKASCCDGRQPIAMSFSFQQQQQGMSGKARSSQGDGDHRVLLKDGERLQTVLRYHDESKHSFQAFAPGPGGLDWANQPNPFRRYKGAEVVLLDHLPPPALKEMPHAFGGAPPNFGMPSEGSPAAVDSAYEAAFSADVVPQPITRATLSQLFYDCLALSAWKRAGWSTWSLRINPSSGNLHPTEGYIIGGTIPGLWDRPSVAHYAPKEHALEIRSTLPDDVWSSISNNLPEGSVLLGLTSVYWREAWKYGMRGFRYCNHDVGHAIGAITVAAANLGWETRMVDTWTTPALELLLGLSHRMPPPPSPAAPAQSENTPARRNPTTADGGGGTSVKHPRPPRHKKPASGMRTRVTEPEKEHPDCLLAIFPRRSGGARGGAQLKTPSLDVMAALTERLKTLEWAGEANRLSKEHVQWPIIDEVSTATAKEGVCGESRGQSQDVSHSGDDMMETERSVEDGRVAASSAELSSSHNKTGGRDGSIGVDLWKGDSSVYEEFTVRQVIHKRRSAVEMDERYGMSKEAFYQILYKCSLLPTHASCSDAGQVPFSTLPWRPQVHLAIFAHRIADVSPGLYILVRDDRELAQLRSCLRPEFEWVRPESCPFGLPFYLLAKGDVRSSSIKLSCNQEIAGDSCFSLGMLAKFEPSLLEHGPSFYPRLFWETGVVGQQLYLEAHAVGVSATGIGCFFDDPVHQVLGLSDKSYQSLYHFTVGVPVEDPRILQLPPYPGPNIDA